VLIVDDEELLRMLAREALELAGFEVADAVNGAHALEMVERTRPDIILLDVKMPVMNGFRACERMREMPESRHKPIMMMTSLDDVDSIRRAFEVGATDFDPKPTNWMILGHRVEYMLRSSQASNELRANRAKLVNAQRIARLGYWEWLPQTNELSCSDELGHILGVDREELPEDLEGFVEAVHPEDRQLVEQEITAVLEHDQRESVQFRLLREDDTTRFVQQQAERVENEHGEVVGLTAIVQDVTERRKAQEEIRFLAYYDGLTSLPNRRSFNEKLNLALSSAARHQRLTALLLLDLDRFQRLNDTLGLVAGDHVLQQVAERLLSCVRSTDVVGRPGVGDVVARLDGDEFGVLLTEVADVRSPAQVAERLAKVVAKPYEVDGQKVCLTVSTGITLFPEDGPDAETLTQNAEAAMYHAKELGGDSFWYYSRSMNAETAQRLELETDLRGAIARDELELHYQPVFNINSGQLAGVEALLRWRHPARGMLMPDTFIPIAEESGLILELGEWVLKTTCDQIKKWQVEGLGNICVSVNLSPTRTCWRSRSPSRT
jgi:diguanylate cyclase (GGDEF)-like protein/PAS domain S-box-containing protein